MKKMFFFILFIFKSIFSSEFKNQKITKEDIVRKHFYILLQKKPSTTSEQLREIHFRALSFDQKNEESFIFQSDVYILWQKLKEHQDVDRNGNDSVVKNYLDQIRKNRPKVTYNYLKKVKEASLQKKDADPDFELKLQAFDLYKELKELKYL